MNVVLGFELLINKLTECKKLSVNVKNAFVSQTPETARQLLVEIAKQHLSIIHPVFRKSHFKESAFTFSSTFFASL